MYDTARRVGLVKKRVREMTRRKRRRGIYGLSAVCMLLFAAMIEAAGLVIGQGETAAQGIFGAMLLRRDAGGYVLLGTVSFAAAVVLTVLCIRLRDREKMRKDRADRHEKTVICAAACQLYAAVAAACGCFGGERADGYNPQV